jgi:hypothetical protein
MRRQKFWFGGASTHLRAWRFAVALFAVTVCGAASALKADSALATSHLFGAAFGSTGSGTGQFETGNGASSPSGVAVSQTTGDIYVADPGNSRIDQFDAAGSFTRAWGWGVADGSTEAPQVCTSICFPGLPGFGAGQLYGPTFVAVDNSGGPSNGDVYVGDANNTITVSKFDSSGRPLTTWGSEGQLTLPSFEAIAGIAITGAGDLWVLDPGGELFEYDQSGALLREGFFPNGVAPVGIAADSTGNLYVVDGSRAVEKLDATGTVIGTITADTGATGVALDQESNDLYVDEGTSIEHFQSSCDPSASPCPIADSFGSGHLTGASGVGVNSASGTVYAGDGAASQVDVFAPAILPRATTGSASSMQPTSATVNGTVDPQGVQVTDCRFEYGTTIAYGHSVPCVEAVGEGIGAMPVHADVSGLSPVKSYHFRLVAGNANGSVDGNDKTLTTPPAPTAPAIAGTSVTDVTATEGILSAQVNPGSSKTTFHFEYGTTTAYGTNAPVPDGDLGAASSDQLASTPISGLAPDATYHFRVVAKNGEGTTDGPDHTFTTFALAQSGLPDGRAYELVTSVDTAGNDIGQTNLPIFDSAISAEGDHVIYTSEGAFADAPNGLGGHYVATRTRDGWVTTPAALPPGAGFVGVQDLPDLQGITPDFSTLFYSTPAAIEPNDRNASVDVYAFHLQDGSASWISQNGALETAAFASTYVGSSADGNHVLFDTPQQLTPSDAGQLAGQALYDRSDGHTTLVGVNTDGSLTSTCGATVGNVKAVLSGTALAPVPAYSYAVSADGSRVFFESPDPQGSGDASCSPGQGGTQPVQLYLREDGARTTEISLSQKAGSVGTPAKDGATFQGATPDGSQVFFRSPDQLTDDPAAASGGLYRYEVARRTLTFIAGGPGTVYTDRGGDPLISSDGSRVYLLASVAGNGPPGVNLYLWDDGRISVISPAPAPQTHGPSAPDASFSGDGLTLAFTAANDLTGFESHGFYEVYVYRATTRTLTCISCEGNGVAPSGNATFFGDGRHESNLATRLVSEDGSRVFFASPERLLPQATNGLYNVYEWEAAGRGSCDAAARDGGCLFLLSDGNGSDQAWLVGASADGRDVLFATNASLVPQDQDGGDTDLYDARADGGFPGGSPVTQCDGDSCRSAPAAQPDMPSIGSITFSGPGDATPSVQSTAATLKITRTSIRGSGFVVRVNTPGDGRINGGGPGLTSVKRAVEKAGTYTLTFTLTAKSKRALGRKHKLALKVRVTYTPDSGVSSSVTVSAAFRQSKRKPGRAVRTRGSTVGAGG